MSYAIYTPQYKGQGKSLSPILIALEDRKAPIYSTKFYIPYENISPSERVMTKLLLILTLFVAAASAVEQKGFAGIPFGVTQDEVVESVFKMGSTPESQMNTVLIPVYHLGDLPVEVLFRFNRAGLFYSYELRTGAIERERLPKAIEAVRYMSEKMEALFGAPFKKNFFRVEELQSKKVATYWLWNDPEVDVATYIKLRDVRFFTQSTVTHKQLARGR